MSVTFTAEELSRIEATVEALLSPAACADADSWRDLVLERLANLLHADRALFGLAMPGVDSAYRLFGADERDLEPYLTYYRHVDPGEGVAAAMEEGILSGTLLIPWIPGGMAGYVRSEVYNEYYKPLGVEDHLSVCVEPSLEPGNGMLQGATAALFAYRSRWGTDLFGDKGVAIMRLLRPALLAGVEALHALALERPSLERTVDLMRDAAWLCSAAGEVLHQNAAMARLLASDPERARLSAALRSAASSLALLSSDRHGYDRERALRPQLGAVRTRRARYRVRGSLLEIRGRTCEPAMVIVLERYGREIPSLELLQKRFGLTRRQGEVALLLCQRRRNSEIAKLLSISPNTARHHTESVLLKLGVRSRLAVEGVIVRAGGAGDTPGPQ